MAVKNLVFDIGGVLIGFRSPAMLVDAGYTQEQIDSFSKAVFQDPLWEEFDLENYTFDEVVDMYLTKYPEQAEMSRWVFTHTHLMQVPWPKVWEKVQELKKYGYHLYYLSNYCSFMFHNHLNNAWVLDEMDGGVISYQVHKIKPQKEIYETLLQNYHLNPEECVFFDDRPENIEGAKRVGMNGHVVKGQEHILELLEEYREAAPFRFRTISPDEAEQAAEIEQICFPPNEACKWDTMIERAEQLSDTFLVAENRKTGKIAGFINGVATNETRFRDEFFTDITLHNPSGYQVMILGVDVLPEYRGQGLARELMRQFVLRAEERHRKKLILTCLPDKIPMYEKFGFKDLGMSGSAWGGESWHEMSLEIVERKSIRR